MEFLLLLVVFEELNASFNLQINTFFEPFLFQKFQIPEIIVFTRFIDPEVLICKPHILIFCSAMLSWKIQSKLASFSSLVDS